MLRVSAGHYRDSFRRIVYDVYRVKTGVWTFAAHNAIGLNLGRDRECETKEACERLARLSISDALDNQKR
jgi:hypothetical protein